MIQVAYAVVWWLVLVAVGLVTFPLVARVCNRLQDKGYSISKPLGLLVLTYFSWLLASAKLVKFGYINISISLLLLLALSFFLGRKHLDLRNLPLRSMAISEAIFSGAFVLFLVFLMYKPDIFFAYSEDFMDFAFIQSILRSDYFPPHDPWLAGESIPYYYGGHLLVALLTLVSSVPPGIAYNLAMAMFFALAVCGSYGLGYNATKRKLYGVVAAAFVCLVGYISGIFQLFAYFTGWDVLGHSARAAPSFLEWLLSFDLGAQVIPHTGNSYPLYTFLQGELHAHTMSIPFQLMYIMLVFALFKKAGAGGDSTRSDSLLKVFILGLSLGFFLFINTWEYPAYAAFTLFAFMLLKIDLDKKGILGVIGLSLVLYAPYYILRGTSGIHGIGLVDQRTHLVQFVELFALFLVAVFSLFYVSSGRRLFKGKTSIATAILAIVAALVAFLFHFQLVLVLVPLLLVPLCLIHKSHPKKETEFMLLLVLTGALIVLFCETFYIDDAYSAPFERYNTVLKFYLQIWILLGLASAYAVFAVLKNIGGKAKTIWVALLLLLVAASVLQPIGLTAGWTSGRHTSFGINRGTLDGLAYVKTLDQGDYEAIQWIDGHIEGSPTILEAPGSAYEYTSRISTLTGLPTVIGWVTHEVMWRGSWDEVAGRDTDVNTIYGTADDREAIALLRKYNVEYIYVGTMEKERCGTEGLLKFATQPERYTLVYENQDVRIYQVIAQ